MKLLETILKAKPIQVSAKLPEPDGRTVCLERTPSTLVCSDSISQITFRNEGSTESDLKRDLKKLAWLHDKTFVRYHLKITLSDSVDYCLKKVFATPSNESTKKYGQIVIAYRSNLANKPLTELDSMARTNSRGKTSNNEDLFGDFNLFFLDTPNSIITLITEMMLVCDYSETALNQPLQFTYLTMDCHASVVEFNALKASLTNPGLFFRFFIGQPPVIRSLTHGGSSLSKHKLRLETDPKGKVLGFSGQLVVQNTEPTPTINQPRTLSNGHTVNIEHVYPVGVDIMAERVNQMLFLNGQQYAYHSSSKTPCEWSVAFFNLYPTLKFIVVAHKKDLSPNANPRGEQTKTLGPKIVGSLSDFNLFLLPDISSAQKLLENAILSGEGFQNRAVNQPHSGNEPRFKYRIIETRMTEAEFNQLNTSVTNSSQFFTALDDCRGNTHPNSCQIFYEKITPQPPEHRHIPSRPSLRPGPSPHPHSE